MDSSMWQQVFSKINISSENVNVWLSVYNFISSSGPYSVVMLFT